MDKTLFHRFAPVIRSLTAAELGGAPSLYDKLLLAEAGNLRICYAPFDYINPKARIVLVGITPGHTQMLNALKEARRQMDDNASDDEVLKAASATGAFSGSIRPNLTALLDAIGLHQWLGIGSCAELFGSAANLVQATSVLRSPVFASGENYNGSPLITRQPILLEHLVTGFAKDVASLPQAIFIPLGDKVAKALHYLSDRGFIDRASIFDGLPHPSGENGERIAYFLGKKSRIDLSIKTDPDKIDLARNSLLQRVAALA
jgi:hypothetical protein